MTIVTASFTDSRLFKYCVVYWPGRENGESFYENIPNIEGAIHFYDGPPAFEPSGNQMVTFTYPSYEWFKYCLKHSGTLTLFMPFWTLNELLEANDYVGLGFSHEEIEKKFNFFGGTARLCISFSGCKLIEWTDYLKGATKSIESFDQMKACFVMNLKMERISEQLFFYVPEFDEDRKYPTSSKFVFCSAKVARMVYKNITDKSEKKRQDFLTSINDFSERSEFRSWLFEGYCMEKPIKGGEFSLVPLRHGVSNRGSVSGVNLEIPLNSYVHAKKKDFESIDGHYYDEQQNTLYLFQTTTKQTHPVKARAILKHLESMNLSNTDGLSVNLVFVVPTGMNDFNLQEIVMEDVFGKGIANFQQLQQALQTSQRPQQCDKRERLNDFSDIESQQELLIGISQYLLVTEGDYARTDGFFDEWRQRINR